MVTKKTGNPVGRPRRGFERPRKEDPIRLPWVRGGFLQKCRDFYAETCKQVEKEIVLARQPTFSSDSKLITVAAAEITGDPIFTDNVLVAMSAYKLVGSKRRSRILRDLRGDEAEVIAQYARSFHRNTGVSLRVAIAEALAACASDTKPWDRKPEPGRVSRSSRFFVRDIDGKPAPFDTAMRRVLEIISKPQRSRSVVGFTGRLRFVRPAVDGSIVRQPERDMQPLPAEGAFVPDNLFWRRRILFGDVVEVP